MIMMKISYKMILKTKMLVIKMMKYNKTFNRILKKM